MRFRRSTHQHDMPQRDVETGEVELPPVAPVTDDYPERVVDVRERVSTPAYSDAVEEEHYGTSYFDSVPARVNSLLFVAFAAIEGLLALRFTLLAFGASRTSEFVDFVLDVSYPFMAPFENAFTNRTWDEGVIEVNTLLAMGVWLLIFLLLGALINALLPRFDSGGHSYRRTVHSSH